MRLGVNIDHVAVLREARRVNDPDILMALHTVTKAGADQITIHLREDRRHIQDIDVEKIIHSSWIPVNVECSINENILDIICDLQPHRATIVPENRQEITTEGGLDIFSNAYEVASSIGRLHDSLIPVSLFIDPTIEAVNKSWELGAEMVELHTGEYANLYAMLNSSLKYTQHSVKELELPRYELASRLEKALENLKASAKEAKALGLEVAAGHGLNYININPILQIDEISELNIGQSIVARSIFTGLEEAVKDMKRLINEKNSN